MTIAPRILMRSGAEFDLLSPEASLIHVETIAHALAHLCRFNGHTRTFYSVAQHSWLCSYIVPDELAYAALMHDAAEAFLGDIATPLKQLLPDYQVIETRIETALFRAFKVPYPFPPEVKRADLQLLATEKRDLLPECGDWEILEGIEPLPASIRPMAPDAAKRAFLDRYRYLRGGL